MQGSTARIFATDVSVTGADQVGIIGARLYLDNVTTTGNGHGGLYGSVSVKFTDTIANDNGIYGVASVGKVRGKQLTASGNALGAVGEHVWLQGSTVTGNDVDIVSTDRSPRLNASECDRSSDSPGPDPGTPWGVCSLDP